MTRPPFFDQSVLTRTLWTFRREFLLAGAFSMVINLLMLTPPIYMMQIFDRVLVSMNQWTLLALSLVGLLMLVLMALLEWLRTRLLVRASLRLDQQLSSEVFNASFEAYLSQAKANPSRAFRDLADLRQFLTGTGIFAFFDAPWVPIYIAVLFLLHPYLGFLAIGFALIQAALAFFGHRRTLAPQHESGKAQSDSMGFLQGKLQNAEVLEAMGMVSNLRGHWVERHGISQVRQREVLAISNRVSAWSKFIRYAQQSLTLGAGALLVIDGQMSPGGMIAANLLMTRALAPIDLLVSGWRGFIGAREAFDRLQSLLMAYPARDPALTRVAPTGAIALRNVMATAPGRTDPILKGVSFSVAPGTVTVVMGPSGSGKSTLARVLLGIWPDVSGEVLLDERPIDHWNRIELGPYLGYLPQDIELFDGTVAENIARFSEPDPQKVIAAAQEAGLHDMILHFQNGYDTPIGEAGNRLSGGQRQRIGLARAIYGAPPVVVLDEPNANLDDAGEAALVKSVRELRAKGKTVIIITHRPDIVAVADRLLILRDGRVQAEGPRDAVVAWVQQQARQQSSTGPAPLAGTPQLAT